MITFCLNEAIPLGNSLAYFTDKLNTSVLSYFALYKKHPTEVDGIITSKPVSKILINEGSTFADAIGQLPRETRSLVYRIFSKYPMEHFFSNISEDELITNQYYVNVGDQRLDGMTAKVALDNGAALFTVSLHEDLNKNQIEVFLKETSIGSVNNLHGSDENLQIFDRIIVDILVNKLGKFDQFCGLFTNSNHTSRFKKNHNQLAVEIQDVVYNHFKIAVDRGFTIDGDLIKDVTPSKEKFTVLELRIHNPVAYRVYFAFENNVVYLVSIERKPAKKVQSTHIQAATKTIEKMLNII